MLREPSSLGGGAPMSPFHTTCPSAECINRPPIAHTWEISQVHCGGERQRIGRTQECFVLAEGHGTWRLNESNLDPVPAGRFGQSAWTFGGLQREQQSIKKVYFCIDIYNSELSFCVLYLDALIDLNDLLQTFLQCAGFGVPWEVCGTLSFINWLIHS